MQYNPEQDTVVTLSQGALFGILKKVARAGRTRDREAKHIDKRVWSGWNDVVSIATASAVAVFLKRSKRFVDVLLAAL